MNGLLPFLRLLCVPLLSAALGQLILFLVRGEPASAIGPGDVLTHGDLARNGFVGQASLCLWLTVLGAMPALRWLAKRGLTNWKTWLGVWTLVHAPVAVLLVLSESATRWIELQCMLLGMLVVVGAWWHWFYAERSARD